MPSELCQLVGVPNRAIQGPRCLVWTVTAGRIVRLTGRWTQDGTLWNACTWAGSPPENSSGCRSDGLAAVVGVHTGRAYARVPGGCLVEGHDVVEGEGRSHQDVDPAGEPAFVVVWWVGDEHAGAVDVSDVGRVALRGDGTAVAVEERDPAADRVVDRALWILGGGPRDPRRERREPDDRAAM